MEEKKENIKEKNNREETLKTMVGIVSSLGSSGGKVGKEKYWTFSFRFEYWYIEDGNEAQVVNKVIHINKKVLDHEVSPWMAKAPKETILRISYTGDPQSGQISLEDILDINLEDPNLEEGLAEIRREVTYEDADLGQLILNKGIDVYVGTMDWCKSQSELMINTDQEDQLVEILKIFKEIYANRETWEKKAKAFAAKELLSLKNEDWLDEDEEALTQEDFMSRISLESFSMDSPDEYSLWYDDGDIFWGHVIIINGSFENGFEDVEIAG